jgi:hypothetical protein
MADYATAYSEATDVQVFTCTSCCGRYTAQGWYTTLHTLGEGPYNDERYAYDEARWVIQQQPHCGCGKRIITAKTLLRVKGL